MNTGIIYMTLNAFAAGKSNLYAKSAGNIVEYLRFNEVDKASSLWKEDPKLPVP